MGSDLYMEERNWRPRPPIVEWEGDELVVKIDTFYHGYGERFRGVPDADGVVAKMLKALVGCDIPPKPERGPWLRVCLDSDNAAAGIGHAIWFLMENGYEDAAAAVENEFGVTM